METVCAGEKTEKLELKVSHMFVQARILTTKDLTLTFQTIFKIFFSFRAKKMTNTFWTMLFIYSPWNLHVLEKFTQVMGLQNVYRLENPTQNLGSHILCRSDK